MSHCSDNFTTSLLACCCMIILMALIQSFPYFVESVSQHKNFLQGIQTAKLPIEACIKLASSRVLTVNLVVEILLSWLECKDWKEAFFKVIPTRKRANDLASAEVTADVGEPHQDKQQSIGQADAVVSDLRTHVDAAAANANDDGSCVTQAEQPAQKRTKTQYT